MRTRKDMLLMWLLGALLLCPSVALAEDLRIPSLVDRGRDEGIVGFVSDSNIAPVWFDVDEDGVREPLYVSFDEVRVLDQNPDGSFRVDFVEVKSDVPLVGVGMPTPVTLVLDATGDGKEDLMVFGATTRVYELKNPWELVDTEIRLPMMGGAGLFDAATGDLNNDGLPDVVIAHGVMANELMQRVGYPDLILMNLGHGRFERHVLEPSRDGFANGVTLADVDGDRRLDVVESINYSAVVGASRILLNRTPAGAPVPVFEPMQSELTIGGGDTDIAGGHDTGTHGMGACVDDVDGDGHVDIFNTSTGLDQLSMGRADGGFNDATFTHGIFHHWGEAGVRVQWSPSFVDFNMDGRLDIYVRHGGLGMMVSGVMGPSVTDIARDPAYVQAEDGRFVRVDVPLDEDYTMGRNAVFGDLDLDGRPDLALGGGSGASGFLHNETEVPSDTRLLVVRFKPTISMAPAIGARVVATCDGVTHSRMTSSGGKMGSAAATEAYFAWPGCSGDPEVVVEWPSGADTTHTAEGLVLDAEEPAWFLESQDLSEVTLDPVSAGATEACIGEEGGPMVCCAAEDAPCTLTRPESSGGPMVAMLKDRQAMALSPTDSRWVLVTNPEPIKPGAEAVLHMMHVGPAADWEDVTASGVFVEGQYLLDLERDDERQMLTRVVTIPEDAESALNLELYPTLGTDAVTWSVPFGWSLDPNLAKVDVYPHRTMGGVTELWTLTVFVTGVRGYNPDQIIEHVKLYAPDGTPIKATGSVDGMSAARLRLLANWEDLEGYDQVILRDGPSGFEFTIDIPEPKTMDETDAAIDHVIGGPMWNRLAGGGETTAVFFGLYDAEGRLLNPEPDLVYLEMEGCEALEPLDLAFGRFQLLTVVATLPGETEGRVRVRSMKDDRVLGEFPFFRHPPGGWGADMANSTAELVEVDDIWATGATHEVVVRVANALNEVLAGNAPVNVTVNAGGEVMGTSLAGDGTWVTSVKAQPGQVTLEIDVVVDGEHLTSISQESNTPIPPGWEPPEDTDTTGGDDPEPDTVEPDQPVEDPTEPAPTTVQQDDGGCSGAVPSGGLITWLLALGCLILIRRRAESPR